MATLPPRLVRLFEKADDLDAVLVVNDPPDATFHWATGLHHGGTFEGAACVLRPDTRPLVIVPQLEETTARKSTCDVVVFSGNDGFKDAVTDALDGLGRVGVDLSKLPVKRYRTLADQLGERTLKDCSEAVRHARLIKDADEVEAMRGAIALTDRLADHMGTYLDGARTEAELAANLVRAMLAEGANTSFDPIVAWGPGSAEPHYSPHSVPLKDGPLLVDMGCKADGYCSDITRTYSIGAPSKEFVHMHEVVVEAADAAIELAAPGVSGGDVHKAAAEVIDASEFKGRFIHSVGHSLGVEVHDGAGLHPSKDVNLEPGMVFTIEPGVYVPELAGVRVEDNILITRNGCDVLTRADRSLRELAL